MPERLLSNGFSNSVFCAVRVGMLNRKVWGNQLVVRVRNWNGAVIQRGLEPGSREIVLVKAVTRQLLVKRLRAGKDLECALVSC
jgi:hypothetical protein